LSTNNIGLLGFTAAHSLIQLHSPGTRIPDYSDFVGKLIDAPDVWIYHWS